MEIIIVKIKRDRFAKFLSLLNFLKISENGEPLVFSKSKHKFTVTRELNAADSKI